MSAIADLREALAKVSELEGDLAIAKAWRNEAIARCVANGMTSGDVARETGLAPGTVSVLARRTRKVAA